MNINKPVIITPENESRFHNFIVFDPSSTRINENDILFTGYKVQEIFDELRKKLTHSPDLRTQIIQNRLAKIGQMLELLSNYENVLISKFFDRVWRRYSHISNLGESFLNINTFLNIFPQYSKDKMTLIAKRIDLSSIEEFQTANSDQNNQMALD